MFYTQCWKCGNRWSLGTGSTCTCPDETTKSEWVGLTDEERQDIALEVPMDAVLITEAKLKEKNT